jgi:hypothetical protein
MQGNRYRSRFYERECQGKTSPHLVQGTFSLTASPAFWLWLICGWRLYALSFSTGADNVPFASRLLPLLYLGCGYARFYL